MIELPNLLANPVFVVPDVLTGLSKLVKPRLNLHFLWDLLGVEFKELVCKEHFLNLFASLI